MLGARIAPHETVTEKPREARAALLALYGGAQAARAYGSSLEPLTRFSPPSVSGAEPSVGPATSAGGWREQYLLPMLAAGIKRLGP